MVDTASSCEKVLIRLKENTTFLTRPSGVREMLKTGKRGEKMMALRKEAWRKTRPAFMRMMLFACVCMYVLSGRLVITILFK